MHSVLSVAHRSYSFSCSFGLKIHNDPRTMDEVDPTIVTIAERREVVNEIAESLSHSYPAFDEINVLISNST